MSRSGPVSATTVLFDESLVVLVEKGVIIDRVIAVTAQDSLDEIRKGYWIPTGQEATGFKHPVLEDYRGSVEHRNRDIFFRERLYDTAREVQLLGERRFASASEDHGDVHIAQGCLV